MTDLIREITTKAYLGGERDKGEPFASPVGLFWDARRLDVAVRSKQFHKIFLGGFPVQIRNINLAFLVGRSNTFLSFCRVRYLRDKLEVIANDLGV